MKQNKKYSAIIVAIIVLVANLAIPSLAYTDTSINGVDFTDMPFTMSQFPNQANSFIAGTASGGNYLIWFNTEANYYLAGYKTGSSYYVVAISDSNNGKATYYYNRTQSTVTTDTSINSVDDYWYHIVSTYDLISNSTTIPLFDDFDALKSAFADWIENPPVDTNPHSLTLSVPAGNALYIDVRNNSNLSITMTMQSDVAHPYNWSSNQYFGYATEYPSSFDGNPSGSNVIEWHGYGDKTILNRYKTFTWSLIPGGPSHQYFFICNPYATVDEYDQSFNPTIIVTVNSANGYKYYQMTGGISESGAIGQHTDGVTGSGVYDNDSETWVTVNDSTGLPWEPQEGGGNIITNRSINDWLQQISSQIGNFFSGAIGAVTNLVSAGSAFFQTLIGLYGWLPISVMSVLSSALIIVITIGVIKVFL